MKKQVIWPRRVSRSPILWPVFTNNANTTMPKRRVNFSRSVVWRRGQSDSRNCSMMKWVYMSSLNSSRKNSLKRTSNSGSLVRNSRNSPNSTRSVVVINPLLLFDRLFFSDPSRSVVDLVDVFEWHRRRFIANQHWQSHATRMSTSFIKQTGIDDLRKGSSSDLSIDEIRLLHAIPQVEHVQRLHHERNGRKVDSLFQTSTCPDQQWRPSQGRRVSRKRIHSRLSSTSFDCSLRPSWKTKRRKTRNEVRCCRGPKVKRRNGFDVFTLLIRVAVFSLYQVETTVRFVLVVVHWSLSCLSSGLDIALPLINFSLFL